MARSVRVHLTDDLDGSAAAETVRFAVDGIDYEIDLNDANAEALRRTAAPYIVAGRRIPRGLVTGARTTGDDANELGRNQTIRAWARRSGVTINARGQIPADVVARFEQDNGR
jgi:hypothetical protein